MDFNNIYITVDTMLLENGYWKKSIEEKKKLVDESLKKYLISKINEIGSKQIGQEADMIDLFSTLAMNIPKDKHDSTISHCVHYLRRIMSSMQGFEFIWYVEDNPSLIQNPLLEYNDKGLIDHLVTDLKTPYTTTFNHIYTEFKNRFLSDSNLNILELQDNSKKEKKD